MRPTIDELLAGARQTLEDVVMPDLQSSFARSRARMVARVLDYVRRTLAGRAAFVEAEQAALLDLLAAIQRTLADAAARRPDLPRAAEQSAKLVALMTARRDYSGSLSTDPADDEDPLVPLTAALDAAIEALDDLEQADPHPAYAAARARIRDHLRASLERELALTGTRRTNVAP